jgi:prepilin-type N-terminal cleavage/methylation domain-containing protein
MKQSMFSKQSQKGFTLLELLIVVTIIAILSVGAILAYDGLTENAQSATAANNTVSADQSIRNYRAVTGNYPNQWDHLVTDDGDEATATGGAALDFVADETYSVLATVDLSSISGTIAEAFEEVGIDELQARRISGTAPGTEPNLQHSEGAASDGQTIEVELEDGVFPDRLVVIPTASDITDDGNVNPAFCTVAGQATDAIDGGLRAGTALAAQNYMTTINDNLGEDECHLVVALGFGHDAAHSTVNSNVAIAAAPAFISNNINPATNYARYIALFDMGVDANENGDISETEIYAKPRLIGIIDPEGKTIDQNVAAANTGENN